MAREVRVSSPQHHPRTAILRLAIAGSWAYYTYVFAWALLYFTTGDRLIPVALANTVAEYLFFPLPAVALVAAMTHRRELWVGTVIGVGLFLFLWGRLFIPRPASSKSSGSLRVMTYNVLGFSRDTAAPLGVIRSVAADVVVLQELNTALARELTEELSSTYPFQILDPIDDVRGMGTISKVPIALSGDQLPQEWVGTPQVMSLEWNGRRITLVNFHMWAYGLSLDALPGNFRGREAQARALADFAQRSAMRGPVIAGGDVNASLLHEAYRIVASELDDSWVESGFGLGHTFPGSSTPGSSRPQIGGISVPQWLVRIDYVFHSSQLRAVEAHLAPFDGVSDHRGVVVELVLR